jgi:hypothetical protein
MPDSRSLSRIAMRGHPGISRILAFEEGICPEKNRDQAEVYSAFKNLVLRARSKLIGYAVVSVSRLFRHNG